MKLQSKTTYVTRNRGLVHTGIPGFGSSTISAYREIDKSSTLNYNRTTGRVQGLGISADYDIVKRFVPCNSQQSEPMKDTEMDLNPDPMCIPTLATFETMGNQKSFALDLRQYIEFVLCTEHQIDPMNPNAIY